MHVCSKIMGRRKRYSDSAKPKSQPSNNVNLKLNIRLIRYVLKSKACGRRLNAANGRLRSQIGRLGSCKLWWYVIRPLFLLSLLNQPIQASFTAEETSQDRIDSDTTPLLNSIEARRVQQLETLLTEYKATVDSLTKEMAAIGGGDPLSLGSGRSRKELAEEAEMERAAKVEIQKGTIPFLSSYDLPADSLLA
jgi:hypothetical protein